MWRIVLLAITLVSCTTLPPPPNHPEAVTPPRPDIHVVDKLASAQLIYQRRPVYPRWAKQQGIQGVVRFTARIRANGTIDRLTLVEGPAALVPYAEAAVRTWRYKPTMLNGEPIEVKTTIDVSFTLDQ